MKNYFLFIGGLCVFAQLYSQQIVTDRPDQTESSLSVPVGALQVETGAFAEFYEGQDKRIAVPFNLFRYGIAKGFEIRMVNQYENVSVGNDRFDGITDLELGFKVELLNKENSNTQVGFLSHAVIPTGNDGISNDRWGVINRLLVAHTLSDKLDLGYNIGYNYLGTGSGNLTYTLALAVGLNDKWSLFVEPYGEWIDFDEDQHSFNAGFTYLLQDHVQLDFSFGTGINHQMNFISGGVSWLIMPSAKEKE